MTGVTDIALRYKDNPAPIVVEFILCIYWSPRPELELAVRWDSVAGLAVRQMLLDNELIRHHKGRLQVTSLGRDYIDRILAVKPLGGETLTFNDGVEAAAVHFQLKDDMETASEIRSLCT